MERNCFDLMELPCIWVLAGVLSYRLCDRHYDCENCELFHALRGGERDRGVARSPSDSALAPRAAAPDPAIESLVSSYVCRLTAGCQLHLDRPYSPCHLWLLRLSGERVALGLDGHLLRVLYPVADITMPRVGQLLERGEPCAWIARGRLAVPLTAPIAGEVEAVNRGYIAGLRRRGAVNGGDDWLLSLSTAEDPDAVPGLYRGEETLAWYLKTIQLLKRHLRGALGAAVDDVVGTTMADGGEPNFDLEQVLGRERFEALVAEIVRLQI